MTTMRPIDILIVKCGGRKGVTNIADWAGVAVQTVYSWKRKPDGHIPSKHIKNIYFAALENGYNIHFKDFL